MLYVEHAPRDTYCPWRPGGQDLSMCICTWLYTCTFSPTSIHCHAGKQHTVHNAPEWLHRCSDAATSGCVQGGGADAPLRVSPG